jgi:hypothetical protein
LIDPVDSWFRLSGEPNFRTAKRWTFRQAATKYLEEGTNASLGEDVRHLKLLDGYIDDLYLDHKPPIL